MVIEKLIRRNIRVVARRYNFDKKLKIFLSKNSKQIVYSYKTNNTMKSVEVVSEEERIAWRQRAQELRLHTKDRPKYYPFNIDEWEEKGKEIVYKYNVQLQELNKKRKQVEEEFNVRNQLRLVTDIELKKQQLKQEQEEKARLNEKRNETRRKNKLERENNQVNPRRSRRIANGLKQKEMIAVEALLSLKNARL